MLTPILYLLIFYCSYYTNNYILFGLFFIALTNDAFALSDSINNFCFTNTTIKKQPVK